MSQPPRWADQALKILPAKKRVLAVEGKLDLGVYSKWLERLAAAMGTIVSSILVVLPADGKPSVLKGLEWFRDEGGNPTDVFGLLDRDEWDAATIATKRSELPQLLVNEDRHCLESYFSEPGEIEAALQLRDAVRYGPGLPGLRTRLESAVLEWVDHWSLWVTTNWTQGLMHAAEFPSCYHNHHPIPSDSTVQAKFEEWARVRASTVASSLLAVENQLAFGATRSAVSRVRVRQGLFPDRRQPRRAAAPRPLHDG